ncbi:MAG: ParB/RepB/Spo0J family partition protein, partial [Bdellovibrionales bacterium]|nr:ParB/RepB/Spo0J family partition protein [Bdellovibrionales bacterium]
AIVENAQRENLNAVEEARSFQRLLTEFSMNQTAIAAAIGKNRATVSNALRLLQLESELLECIEEGDLSAGHGRALLMVSDEELRRKLANKVLREGLSVRSLEQLIRRLEESQQETEQQQQNLSEADQRYLERWKGRVSEMLGVDAKLSMDPQGRKRLNITFPSEASWKRFLSRIRD